jgi:diaminopimelate decarboxylase
MEKTVFAGVGKSAAELREALRAGIHCFNVESVPELELLNREAGRLGRRQRAALRINPDVEARTHRKITTGKAENKFGIDMESAERLFLDRKRFRNLEMRGVHIHIGSQITQLAPFRNAFTRILGFVHSLEKRRVDIDSIDVGGGLGILYHNEEPLTPQQYGSLVTSLFRNRRHRLILEPGRFISGNSGILVTQVNYKKTTPSKNFLVVDAGMNDLVRPSVYDAYHAVWPVRQVSGRKNMTADVVGPICETGDVLARGRIIRQTEAGELVAVMSAGAYGFSMSSNYNSRPRAAEVMVKGSQMKVIRRRETYRDLVALERA